MVILKYNLKKKDEKAFLEIEIDTSSSSDDYVVLLTCHKNRNTNIDITDKLVKFDGNIVKGFIDLKEVGIINNTVILMDIVVDNLDHYKALIIDPAVYYDCLYKEILKLTEKECSNDCDKSADDKLLQFNVILSAFKDAHKIGLVEDTFKLATFLDRLCNTNCKTCSDA